MTTALRILVIDDNVDTATSLSLVLQCWGHEVYLAHDGPSAVEAAQTWQPDALLLDIGLPGMDGFEVAARLRSMPGSANLFIVAASGFGRDLDRRRAKEVGIDLYLVKPFDPWRLEAVFASCPAALAAVPA